MLKAHPASVAVVAVALAALIGLIVWLVVRRRPTPEELEKRRRLMVNQAGRTIEGEISDADPHRLHYVYRVRGVEYSATQDIDSLLECLPCEPCRVIGEVSVKYLQGNAANSIVVCEEWSGLPARPPAPVTEAEAPAVPPEERDGKEGRLGGEVPEVRISVVGIPAYTAPGSEKEL